MNIKKIVDKIVKEADINPAEYTVEDRLEDVNAEYFARIEKAVQIGSTSPISKGEAVSETFTVVAGSNTFTRTIKDVPIERVDFMPTGATRYQGIKKDPSRGINTWCSSIEKYFHNEKQFFVENGTPGTLRVTYARGSVTGFTEDDYDNVTPPSPDFLPEVFHPLLWLKPAMTQAGYYKKDRYQVLKNQYDDLNTLFDNHYGRDAVQNSRFETRDTDECGFEDNHR